MTDEELTEPPRDDEPATPGSPIVRRGRDERVPPWLDTSVQYTWRGLVLVLGAAVVLWVLTQLYLVTLPILLALILATLCVPPARKLERRGFPRIAAAALVVIGGIGSFAGVIALLTPPFVSQIQELQPTVAEGVDTLLVWLEEGPLGYDRTELENLFSQSMEQFEGAAGAIATQVGTIAVGIAQGFTALLLAIVLLFFFVKDGEQIVDWFVGLVPDRSRDNVRAAGTRGWVALSGFVRGTALVALVDAVGIGIGLAIVGVPLVLPLAVLVFFGGFIPVIGATVTGLLAVLVALADGGITDALIVGGIVLLVQQVESNVLQPTIMRRAVALHPTVILGVLTAGAVLIGVVGAFLAVPVAAVAAAVGNELRLRSALAGQGGVAGPEPIGGPGVDPETVSVRFPEDTRLRAARHRRGGEGSRRHRRSRTREVVTEDGTVEQVTVRGGDGPVEDTDDYGELRTSELKDLRRRTERRDDDAPGAPHAGGDEVDPVFPEGDDPVFPEGDDPVFPDEDAAAQQPEHEPEPRPSDRG